MFFENLPYILYVYPYFRREPVLGDWLLTTVSPTTLEGVIAKNIREPSLLPPIPAAGFASNPEEL